MRKACGKFIFFSTVLVLLCGFWVKPMHAEASTQQRAQEILDTMSWKEKVAQMFLVTAPQKNPTVIQKKYQFGGYIFFTSDFERRTPSQFKALVKKLQNRSDINMLTAVDEEGGTVTRASAVTAYRSKKFDSPRTVYNRGGYSAIIKDTRNKAKFLKALGINTNLAPVADVASSKSDFIYQRSFSTNSKSVSRYIKNVVNTMKKNDVVSSLKHFPGYGNNGDTHTNIVRDNRKLSTFKKRDLVPFQTGINAGCDMVMVSHNIVNCFDKKNPASLSKKVHQYLRNTMKFEGVIISDGLDMAGVTKFVGGSDAKAAVRAVKAGNDMICTANYQVQFPAVYRAVKDGEISKKQINASVKRILVMKLNRGIIK